MKATRPRGAVLAALIAVLSSIVIVAPAGAVVTLAPELEEELRARGVYEQVTAQVRAARDRGLFDLPPLEEGLAKTLGKKRVWRAAVILVDFADYPASGLYNQPEFDDMLFSEGTYPTGSMRDFYLENSYGDFQIQGDVVGWLRMPQPLSYYANSDGIPDTGDDHGFGAYPNNARKLYEDAVDAADPLLNYAQYTNGAATVRGVFVVHAGPGAETTGNPDHIWSHQSGSTHSTDDGVQTSTYIFMPERQGSGMSTVGVFCHEFGHVLNLPDLYDTDGSSRGIGRWGLMGGGSWNAAGTRPAHYTAWSKARLGYLEPIVPIVNLEAYLLEPATTQPKVFRLESGDLGQNEYYLVENRQRTGFDDALPGEGLILYHIDGNRQTNSIEACTLPAPDHPIVRVVQADALCELELSVNSGNAGDPFPGSFNVTEVGATTEPSTRAYAGNKSGFRLSSITPQGDDMVFDLQLDETILALVPDDIASLDEALQLAGSGDEIRLPAGYTETGNFTALGGVLISGGWDPTFTTQDPGAPAVLQGGFATKAVLRGLAGSQPLRLDNLVIKDGKGDKAFTPAEEWRGGGVQAQGISVEIRRTRFETNRAGSNDNLPSMGGAIAFENCDVLIEDSSFAGNLAKEGGEIWTQGGSLTIRRSSFEGGALYVPVLTIEQRGGAILAVDTDVVIEDTTFDGYSGADKGGALYLHGPASTAQLTRVDVDGCAADLEGGGIWLELAQSTLRDVDLRGNSASSAAAGAKFTGGVLDWGGGTIGQNTGALLGGGAQLTGLAAGSRLSGVAIVDNQATAAGGGLIASTGQLDLEHLTIAGNQGGGAVASGVTFSLHNSIVASNVGTGMTVAGSTVTGLDHNLWFDNSGGDLSGATMGPEDRVDDPLFAGAGDFHLGAASPGIDSGDPVGDLDFDGSLPDRGAWGGGFDRGERPRALATATWSEPVPGDLLLEWTLDDTVPATEAATVDVYWDAPPFKAEWFGWSWVASVPAADGQWLAFQGEPGRLESYQLQPVDAAGRAGSATDEITNDATATPPEAEVFRVGEASPNPFNPSTRIELNLPRRGRVRAEVYDLAGRRVRELLDQPMDAGEHVLRWEGRDGAERPVASGVYLLRIRTEDGSATRRLVLVK